jgi:hypothetical protein
VLIVYVLSSPKYFDADLGGPNCPPWFFNFVKKALIFTSQKMLKNFAPYLAGG